MKHETSIRELLRAAKCIVYEELDTTEIQVVLAVFERLCLERDHERFLDQSLLNTTKH